MIRRIRESLFFIPTVSLVFFVGMAALALWFDSQVLDLSEGFPLVLSATVSGGRGIATTVAGATITVAAIVFSITALSAQMAASQYSPRSVSGFFEDPFQQAVIGLVVGTFTYSLLILAGLGNAFRSPDEATPSLSVTLAILFGVLSAIGIVSYINHSLRRMQVDSVVRRIADATYASVRRELSDPEDSEAPDASQPEGESRSVFSKGTGWVVDIDTRRLLDGLPPSTAARVGVRVGELVSKGDHILTLWPDPGEDTVEVEDLIHRSIRLSSKRSIATDPTFGVRQLVDIALRALSPGVNDPTTAADVLHHLKIPIREVLVSDPPRRVFTSQGNRAVYLAETPSRSDYVHLAFAEIRLASSSQLSVIEALIEVLEDLGSELDNAELGGRAAAIKEELRLTIEMARQSGFPESDLLRVLGTEIASGPEDESDAPTGAEAS